MKEIDINKLEFKLPTRSKWTTDWCDDNNLVPMVLSEPLINGLYKRHVIIAPEEKLMRFYNRGVLEFLILNDN